MLKDREKVMTALREKPMKIFDVMKRANMTNQEVCQSLLLKMRDEGGPSNSTSTRGFGQSKPDLDGLNGEVRHPAPAPSASA